MNFVNLGRQFYIVGFVNFVYNDIITSSTEPVAAPPLTRGRGKEMEMYAKHDLVNDSVTGQVVSIRCQIGDSKISSLKRDAKTIREHGDIPEYCEMVERLNDNDVYEVWVDGGPQYRNASDLEIYSN